jgi:hypothetical protein
MAVGVAVIFTTLSKNVAFYLYSLDECFF